MEIIIKPHNLIKTASCFNFFFFLLLINTSYTQESRDTLTINQSPVYVNKEITIEKTQYQYIQLQIHTIFFVAPYTSLNRLHSKNTHQHLFKNGFITGFAQQLELNQFFIDLGISYNHFKEKFYYCSEKKRKVSFLADQNQTSSYETMDVLIAPPEKIQENNKINFIELPINIGYKININHWQFFLGSGLRTSYVLENSFKQINDTETGTYIADMPVNKRLTLSLSAKVGFIYQFNHINILLSPWYNQILNNNSFYHNKTIGLQFGVFFPK